MYVRSRSSLSSRVIMFLLLSYTVEGENRVSRTRNRQVPLKEGVCIFCCGCSCVYIVVLYTARHRKECVMEVVRVESAESPFDSHSCGQSSSPEVQVYMCVRS